MPLTEKKYKQKLSLGQPGYALSTLIAINLVLFVLFAFFKVLWYFRYEDQQVALSLFNTNVLGRFTLPADTHKLLSQPWSIITFMFIQANVWQVFANMLWLWCFGYILQDLTGNRKIIPVFIYGSLAGAIAFVLAYNLLPGLKPQLPFATMLGAATGVMSVAVVTTMIEPRYRIFPLLGGGMPLWVLTALYVIINLITLSSGSAGNFISPVAGALAGVLFMFFLRRGYDTSEWINHFFDWVNNLFNPDRPKKGKSVREELFYRSSSLPYKKTPNITQQRVDDILDKINQKGYGFLTDEEKELLKRASSEEL